MHLIYLRLLLPRLSLTWILNGLIFSEILLKPNILILSHGCFNESVQRARRHTCVTHFYRVVGVNHSLPPVVLLQIETSSPQKPAPLISRLPPPPWMLPLSLSVSDIEQASAADLLAHRSSPCTSGVRGGGAERLARVKSDFFQHMRELPPSRGCFPRCTIRCIPEMFFFFFFLSLRQTSDFAMVVLCQRLISGTH